MSYVICGIETFCVFGGEWYFSLRDIKNQSTNRKKLVGLANLPKVIIAAENGRRVRALSLAHTIKIIKKYKKYYPADIKKYFRIT